MPADACQANTRVNAMLVVQPTLHMHTDANPVKNSCHLWEAKGICCALSCQVMGTSFPVDVWLEGHVTITDFPHKATWYSEPKNVSP